MNSIDIGTIGLGVNRRGRLLLVSDIIQLSPTAISHVGLLAAVPIPPTLRIFRPALGNIASRQKHGTASAPEEKAYYARWVMLDGLGVAIIC